MKTVHINGLSLSKQVTVGLNDKLIVKEDLETQVVAIYWYFRSSNPRCFGAS